MVAKVQMSWKDDKRIQELISETDTKVKRIITGQFMYHSGLATTYAKENAPWTDQTGAARVGLHSGVSVGLSQDFWELYVAHSVFYGIYLEVRWSGKYEIISPTILYVGKLIIERMESIFDKMGMGYGS